MKREILDEKYEIIKHIMGYNDKESMSTSTHLGIIKNVNVDKFTVDVLIPSTGAMITEVMIGTSVIGSKNSLIAMPSVNQKCIVIVSKQHQPVMISTIQNKTTELNNATDNIRIGNEESSISLTNSMLSMDGARSNVHLGVGGVDIVGDLSILGDSLDVKDRKMLFYNSSESDYYYSKSNSANNESAILSDNERLLGELENMMKSFSETNNEIDLSNIQSKLSSLSSNLKAYYSNEKVSEINFDEAGNINIRCKKFNVEEESS